MYPQGQTGRPVFKSVHGPELPGKIYALMNIAEFRHVGNCLWQRGLISYRAGNLSARTGDEMVITRRGAPLGFLDETLLVKGPLDAAIPGASVELPVHQAIYLATEARAVAHAHPPFAVTLSILLEEFVPADSEGALILGGKVPVIMARESSGSAELAEAASKLLRAHPVVLVRGHGCFARSTESLTDALSTITTLEASAQIACRLMRLKG